jgi:3D (Asp-Asp-Asp) domain-containing protein
LVSRIRISAVFVAIASATVLTVGLGLSNPRTAGAQVPAIRVTIVRDGVETQLETSATDVAELLAEQAIPVEPDDYLSMSPLAPIGDGTVLTIGTARDVLIHTGTNDLVLHTGAPTVAAALVTAGVSVGLHDEVTPSLDSAPGPEIRVVRVRSWITSVDAAVPGGKRSFVYRYTQRDQDAPRRSLVMTRFLRSHSTNLLAHNALRMIATAYVPWCPGCSGITKSGIRAGYGVVAVDPNVIPLGSRLYIPGYGTAIAGDTGGAIVGSRIDLGFDDYGSAMQFGRREVTVYVIR